MARDSTSITYRHPVSHAMFAWCLTKELETDGVLRWKYTAVLGLNMVRGNLDLIELKGTVYIGQSDPRSRVYTIFYPLSLNTMLVYCKVT